VNVGLNNIARNGFNLRTRRADARRFSSPFRLNINIGEMVMDASFSQIDVKMLVKLHGEPFKHVGRKKELLETLNRVTSAEEPSLHAVYVFNAIALGVDHVEKLKVCRVPVVEDHISVLR
jgi:hypothetical protein